MRFNKINLIFLAILVVSMVLAGCGAPATETVLPVVEETETTANPTATVVVESSQENTSAEEESDFDFPAAIGVEVTNTCEDCHTDKQMLIDNAKPIVAVESESSGEG